MVYVEIKGSCVTREALNYYSKVFPTGEKLKVENYYFQKPVAVLASEQINISEELLNRIRLDLINSNSVRNFVISQLNYSFNKNITNKNKSKFFIMDFIDERMNLIKYKGSYIEYRESIENSLRNSGEEYYVVKNDLNIIKAHIDKYIKKLKESYNEENIILHKAYASYTTKINDKEVLLTDTIDSNKKEISSYKKENAILVNRRLSSIYNYIEDNYPDIKIIELEYKYTSDVKHIYGRGFYHYEESYYIDFVKELNSIIEGKFNKEKYRKISIDNKNKLNYLYEENNTTKNEFYSLQKFKKEILEKIDSMEYLISNQNDLERDIIYRDEKNNIITRIIYSRGRIKEQYSYNEGVLSNICKYSIKGIIEEKTEINDKNKRVEIYDENGLLNEIKIYKNNKIKKHIIYGDYKKLGNVLSYSEYNDDNKKKFYKMNYCDGTNRSMTIYNKDGSFNKTEIYDGKGQLKEERFYFNNKNKKEEHLYKDGKKNKITKNFLNGSIREVLFLDNNEKIIKREYRENDKEKFIVELL